MDKLKAYKLDRAFSDGVDIYLDQAPDVAFKVKLPSQYNRSYTTAIYGAMDWTLEDGKVKSGGSVVDTRYAQESAFVEHCLISIDGEAVPDDFTNEYPAALTELMEKANELVTAIEDKVDDSVKKSPALSAGKSDGQAKGTSTLSLSKAAG
jgi:hypothetical protein